MAFQMTNRDRLESALIGGATGLLIVAVYIIIRAASVANAGDWLEFAGVIVGVSLTISGSIAADALRKRSDKHKALDSLIASLQAIEDDLNGARKTPEARAKLARTLPMRFDFFRLHVPEAVKSSTVLQYGMQLIDERWTTNRRFIVDQLSAESFPAAADILQKTISSVLESARRNRRGDPLRPTAEDQA